MVSCDAVPPGTVFEEGLLPTTAGLPKLWAVLGQFARQWTSAEDWARYQFDFADSERQFAAQFRRKAMFGGRHWEGPFAFLVRDAALDGRAPEVRA